MSASGEHLSVERLSREAMVVVEEIEYWLEKVAVSDMHRIETPKQETPNLYYYNSTPALFDLVKRLVKEMPFIEQKVRCVYLLYHTKSLTEVGSGSWI